MKALRAARLLISSPDLSSWTSRLNVNPFSRSFSSPYPEKVSASSDDDAAPEFDSREFSLPSSSSTATAVYSSSVEKKKKHQLWDYKYREKADRILFGEAKPSRWQDEEEENEEKERAKMLAKALLEAALLPPDDADNDNMIVKEEDQRSLSVGIVGAPNAGKSSLTNSMVGTKVAAVSRKTNTTTHEVLGVMTKGNTQIAVKRPWDEEPSIMTEEIMKTISLEVVREKMLDHIHQEIPYVIEHRLMDWKELRDGSLRVEQHFITPKKSQRQILVGKNGSKIGRIGMEANEELRSIFKRDVHLILQVRVARKKGA